MTVFQNDFNKIQMFQNFMPTGSFNQIMLDNDEDGNPIYIGYSPSASAASDEAQWYIQKLTWDDNGALSRVQSPLNGPGFDYVYDDRATYFA